MEIKHPALPDEADELFKSETDWWNNACLNFCHDGWGLHSIGYKEAADILVKQVTEKQRYQDALIYPIVFLYRQYLQLAIKDLIRCGNKLLDICETFPKTHNINQLWNACSKLLSRISPGDSENEIKEISRLLEQFCKVDPTSEAFRYPEDKNGNPSLPGIKHINIRNMSEVINKISVILEGADALIYEYLSCKRGMNEIYD